MLNITDDKKTTKHFVKYASQFHDIYIVKSFTVKSYSVMLRYRLYMTNVHARDGCVFHFQSNVTELHISLNTHF